MKFVLPFILSIMFLNSYAQTHWESIVVEGVTWNYFAATSEPPSNWNTTGFDDSDWQSGIGGIGYGDGDDATIIDPCNSLYMRTFFTVDDISSIAQLVLDVDYDDAFVAYLNGVEIARSANVTEENPSFDSYLPTYVEPLLVNGQNPERNQVNTNHLTEGENLLAVHVINHSIESSDITSRVWLQGKIDSPNTIYYQTPSWFWEPFDFTDSNLPIVVINTQNQAIPDEPKITAHMGIINNGEGERNHIADDFTDYDGSIGIETRGQSSQYFFPKKSYGFETRLANGENNNVSLLGMPEENDWILYAPYSDKSLLRNVLTFEMVRQQQRYSSRTAYCELILNGEYMGVYVLMEKIKRDNNRVAVAKLEPDETSGENLTGGYIIKVDKTDWGFYEPYYGWTSSPNPSYPNAMDIIFQYHYPKPDEIVDEQANYIQNFITETETALIGNSFANKDNGYNKYLNVSSFVDEMVVNEIVKEVDNYRYSTYFHKTKDNKGGELFSGPAWDFNLGYGNVDYYPESLETSGWIYDNVEPFEWSYMYWWKRLMEDSYFERLHATRWKSLRQNELSNENLNFIIDSISTLLDEAQVRNYERWPIIGEYVWPNSDWNNQTYQDEVEFVQNWLFDRVAWIDAVVTDNVLSPQAFLSSNEKGMQVKIELSDEYFSHRVPLKEFFTLNCLPDGLYIQSVEYVNASEVNLNINRISPNEEYTGQFSISIDSGYLTGFENLNTNVISFDLTDMEGVFIDDFKINFNYSSNQLNIFCNQPEKMSNNLQIIDLQGRTVAKPKLNNTSRNSFALNAPSGIYVINMIANGKLYSEKIYVR